MRALRAFGLVCATTLFFAGTASAIPVLQVYIDGATYDSATDTWVTTDTTFDLWVIGNVAGPGGANGATIEDVKLSAAFVTGEIGSISFTPTTTSTVTDPSVPIAPIFNGPSADGARPMLSDGSRLSRHGIYVSGVSFLEWQLGDMSLTDSPMGDLINTFPSTLHPATGQINVYEVTVSGFPSGIHFDTYDTVAGETDSSFGPFSHDAESVVPEPDSATLLLAGLGAVGLAVLWRRRRAIS